MSNGDRNAAAGKTAAPAGSGSEAHKKKTSISMPQPVPAAVSASQVDPGHDKTFKFKALVPGIYLYHCPIPMVAHHIANGMYLIGEVRAARGRSPSGRWRLKIPSQANPNSLRRDSPDGKRQCPGKFPSEFKR
jgi:hypothetical protein